ncbi:hypothetical protein J6590_032398 [Homalodisca vitripennis]|nr:hypothetical protein J6590_032398 [Homalodisca vitripennis]
MLNVEDKHYSLHSEEEHYIDGTTTVRTVDIAGRRWREAVYSTLYCASNIHDDGTPGRHHARLLPPTSQLYPGPAHGEGSRHESIILPMRCVQLNYRTQTLHSAGLIRYREFR